MFGLMTVAKHKRLMAEKDEVIELMNGHKRAYKAMGDELRAEIAANARYVDIGKRRVEALERAKAKKREAKWGAWFAGTGKRPEGVGDFDDAETKWPEDPAAGVGNIGPACEMAWLSECQYRLRADHPFYKS